MSFLSIFGIDPNKDRYHEGYDAAVRLIKRGMNAQELFMQAEGDPDDAQRFSKGWQKGCLDNGAVDPY